MGSPSRPRSSATPNERSPTSRRSWRPVPTWSPPSTATDICSTPTRQPTAYFGIDDEAGPDWGPPPRWAVERYQQEVQPALRATGTWSGELALGRDDGEVPLACVFVAHRGDDGRIARVTAISRDLTATRRFEEDLQHRATHDPLTDLPNRALLMDRLGMALARTARLATGVAVICCDVDRFKLVNEGLGHPAGDDLLRQVAERLVQSVRPGRHRGPLRG